MKNVLQLDDDDIKNMKDQIAQEVQSGELDTNEDEEQ